MIKQLPKLLVVVGPTASGKSDLAVTLAQLFNGELVSADSRQVYQEMNIGTAKLKPPRGVRQWLVDIVPPSRSLSVQQYQRAAFRVIKDIHKRGKLPILVGGTMQYIDAVVENWVFPKANRVLKRELESDLKKRGLDFIVRRLRKVDPKSVKVIDLKNSRRVLRALEVALSSGESFVDQRRKKIPRYDVLKLGLSVPRTLLEARLKKRTEQMVRQGLLTETKKLHACYPKSKAMNAIGYQEAIAHLDKYISRQELVRLVTLHSLQYARRQMTWWKRDHNIFWFQKNKSPKQLVQHWLIKK